MLTEIPNGLDEIIAAYGSLAEPQFENKHIVRLFTRSFQSADMRRIPNLIRGEWRVDMGASAQPTGQNGPWPQGILDAFASAGFFWGGNFKSRKDCMHFQLATGY